MAAALVSCTPGTLCTSCHLRLQTRFPNCGRNVLIQLLDLLLQKTHVIHAVTDHPPVVITHLMPFQGRDHLRDLFLRPAFGKLRNLLCLGLAPQQRFQHQLTGNAANSRPKPNAGDQPVLGV